MASHLHARKKVVTDSGDAEAPPSHHPSLSSHQRPSHYVKKGKGRRPSEVFIAVVSVFAFFAMGLLLGYFLLHHQHRKVILHMMRDPVGHGRGVMRGRQGFRHHFYSGAPRYVTVVMPSVVNPKGRQGRLSAIQDTWGGSARAIYVVHNSSEFPQASHAVISDSSSPEDRYAFPQLLLMPPDIGVEDGVPRLIHTIRTIHKKVDPDFAFFVNDHTFVIPAHLCKYLEHSSPKDDMYHGHALRNGKSDVFNSGAAGYLLSRATMEKLVERFDANDPDCGGSGANAWLQGNPGIMTLRCLNSLGIKATDTRALEKWHRFHAFPLTRVVAGTVDKWYQDKHKEMDEVAGFDPSYNTLVSGEDCCSRDTVSFHYVERKEAKALFAVQENLLEHPHLSNHEVKMLMEAEWPLEKKEIGFYSQGLPKDGDKEAWDSLIATIRKISTRHTQRDC